jgi:hypothetical protein
MPKINWHLVAIVVAAAGAAVTSLESTDPKHLQYYVTALFVLHAIQSALGWSTKQKLAKLSGDKPPSTPGASAAATGVTSALTIWMGSICVTIVLGLSVRDYHLNANTVVAETVGCSSTNVNTKPLLADGEQLGICVVQAAASDLPEVLSGDPASLLSAIAGECAAYGVATAEQILATIEEALASQPAVPDAGPDAGTSIALRRLKIIREAAAHVAAQNRVTSFGGTPK